jgi:sugar/nucleoside kinase (ribokinase family)
VTGAFDRLLHLGNVVIDVVLRVPALPEHGADVLAAGVQTTPGGGFNVMAAAARQGLRVAYAGAHGSGPFAALARAGLAAERIEVLQPPKTGYDTGIVVSMVDDGGERTFVTGPGAEASLTAEDLAPVRAGPRDAVYLSGYGLMHARNRPVLVDWLERLDAANVVIFDPGPLVDQIPAAVLSQVMRRSDWLTCNAREASLLTGEDSPLGAARALAVRAARPDQAASGATGPGAERPGASGRGRGGAVVRTGRDGCLLARAGAEPLSVPGFPVVPVDTSGAGDTHAGTFIAALARGASEAGAARIANAAAAWSVTLPGPATAPTAAELAGFLAARP